MSYGQAVRRFEDASEQEVRKNPLLGLAVILAVCVPFWAAVAWLVL